jgi:hypothetical protein
VAIGGEASLRRRAGTVTGLLAYTYGRTLRSFAGINEGRHFSPAFDRRHDLSAVLHLNLPAGWQITGAYRWASSRPYTEPTGYYTLVDAPYQGHHHAAFVAPRNNARLPAYRRLDLGIGKHGSVTGPLEYEIRLQVLNVLGRRNPWFYTFQIDRTYAVHRFEMPQVPVPVPNLSVRLEF